MPHLSNSNGVCHLYQCKVQWSRLDRSSWKARKHVWRSGRLATGRHADLIGYACSVFMHAYLCSSELSAHMQVQRPTCNTCSRPVDPNAASTTINLTRTHDLTTNHWWATRRNIPTTSLLQWFATRYQICRRQIFITATTLATLSSPLGLIKAVLSGIGN